MKRRGLIFILSAPSGCGKTTLARTLVKGVPEILHPVSYTTRHPRPGERDKRDYNFISKEGFEKARRAGKFLEWTRIYDGQYATSRDCIEKALARGKDVVLSLDARGARGIKRIYPQTVTIFVLPPSERELRKRLVKRNAETRAQVAKRLREARNEMEHFGEYDYCIVNDDINEALKKLKSIVTAERARIIWKR